MHRTSMHIDSPHRRFSSGGEREEYIIATIERLGIRKFGSKILSVDQIEIESALAGLPIGDIRYFDKIGSTNDWAGKWITEKEPPDLSLVIADEQTAGKGRSGKKWHTPPKSALAFSLILHPYNEISNTTLSRVTALGAIAVCDTLREAYGLNAEIKWPNDVLLNLRKVSGILAEGTWIGDQIQPIILGIGINVTPQSIPPPEQLNFPAISVESALEREVNRLSLLTQTISHLIAWRTQLNTQAFIKAWEDRLAFRHDWVQITTADNKPVEGKILGLTPEGQLIIQRNANRIITFQTGEVQLGLVDKNTK